MTISSRPASLTELIHFIGDFVKDRYARTGQTTNGAALATAIYRKYPGFTYNQLGLTRLADAITHAQSEGVVTRQTGITHLEVAPGPAFGIPTLPPDAVRRPAACSNRRFVRPDLWKAMLLFRPEQGYFFDRTTGRVIALQVAPDDPNWVKTRKDNPSYVKIDPIPAEVQKEWMREYIETAKLDAANAPISDDQWWRAFPAWLEAQHYDHLRPWLAFRASRVTGYAQKWADDNNLQIQAVFQPTARPEAPPLAGIDSVIASRPHAPHRSNEAALRNAVLAAIGEMPMHELLDIRVPVRLILRHFRPI